MEIKKTRIQDKKEFVVDGDFLRFREYFPETDTYVYERYSRSGEMTSYEVVRPKYIKQDGERIGIYPSNSDWGTLGKTVWKSRYSRRIIDFLVGTKDWSAESIYEFKKTLD